MSQGCTIRSELQPSGRPHTFIARLLASSFAERCGLIREGDEVWQKMTLRDSRSQRVAAHYGCRELTCYGR